jgi:hypothetical protein
MYAFQEGTIPESFVIVCGQSTFVAEETDRYKAYAPKAVGGTGTALCAQAETTHFAADAYALAGADLENVYTLTELYCNGPERSFNTALNHLLQQTLRVWHQDKYIREEIKTLDELYRERFAWARECISQTELGERVQAIVDQIPTLGSKVERASGILTMQFYGQSFSYPDPLHLLYQTSDTARPVLLMNTSGTLSGDNILTDTSGSTWLTDFADAGLAPLLWDFVAMEAAVRFDWIETNNLQALHEMEQCLVANAFSKLDTRDIEPPLRRPVRAIQVIRRLAPAMVGRDPLSYHLGMLFHATNRLARFNPGFQLTTNELARLAHMLIAAAMLSSKIMQHKQSAIVSTTSAKRSIHVDQANRTAWVDGARVSLSSQSYDLLRYLHRHANQLCTRRELIQHILANSSI